jgi:uncharacterized lipoprotein YmbA
MNWCRYSVVLGIAMMLTACGSTPRSDYYMLSANATEMTGTGGPSLGIGPVEVPAYLQRKEMVLNRDRHKLSVNEYHRWAEPLEAGISRVVSLNLAGLLDTHEVQPFPWRRSAVPDYGISINVVQFAVTNLQAELIAEWTLTVPGDNKTLVSRIARFSQPIHDGEPEQVAAAYSQLLYALSEDIARNIP